MATQKNKIIRCILTDNLEQAKRLIAQAPASGLEELSKLLNQTPRNRVPLEGWKSLPPRFITTSVSYTCGIGCEMCNAGFADKTSLFEDYKYLTHKEFDELAPWIESASHVALVGLGETLDSPHLEYFLERLRDKVTFISTSGVPLNRKVIKKLINAKLHYLNLSFDGKTTAGHGGGRDSYIQKFWEKVALTQKTKQVLHVSHPILHLTVAVDSENICQLDNILNLAKSHHIVSTDLIYMVPHNNTLYEKSVFKNLESFRSRINTVMKKWNSLGMRVRIFEKPKLKSISESCYFVDKHLMFNLNRQKPDLCCGSLDMPLEIKGLTPEGYWNSFPFRYFRFLQFSGAREILPETCQSCWILHPEKFKGSFQNGESLKADCQKLYREAGQFKSADKIEEAEDHYKKIVQTARDPQLIGKSWFHLGELSLKTHRQHEALECMKKAVQFCFDHTLAFAYLALLMRSENERQTSGRNQEPDYEFIELFKPAIPAKTGETTFAEPY